MNKLFNNIDDALGILKTTRNAAAVGAAITGMTVVFTVGYYGLVEYIPKALAFILAFSAVFMVAFVIDYGLRKTISLGFDLLISGQWRNDWRTAAFMVLLFSFNFIQAYSSMKLSWEGRKEAVAVVQQAPELEDIAQTKRMVDQTGNAKIRALDSEITKLRKDIQHKEEEVERLHPTYVEKIEAGKDKWGWHAGELDKMKKGKTGALQTQLTALLAARTSAIEAETKTAAATIANVAQVNTSKWNDYEVSKTRNMAYIGYFGVGCTFILIIISLMLSLIGQSNVIAIEQKNVHSPIRKVDNATPPHVAPAVAKTDDFATQRAIEQLRAETLRIKAQQEAQRNERNERNERNATPQRNEKEERNATSATAAKPVANSVAGDDAALLAATLHKAKKSLRTYRSRLKKAQENHRNATTKEEKAATAATLATQQNGFKKWTTRVNELEQQLQDIS